MVPDHLARSLSIVNLAPLVLLSNFRLGRRWRWGLLSETNFRFVPCTLRYTKCVVERGRGIHLSDARHLGCVSRYPEAPRLRICMHVIWVPFQTSRERFGPYPTANFVKHTKRRVEEQSQTGQSEGKGTCGTIRVAHFGPIVSDCRYEDNTISKRQYHTIRIPFLTYDVV